MTLNRSVSDPLLSRLSCVLCCDVTCCAVLTLPLSPSDASDILDVDKHTGKIKSSIERAQHICKAIVQ